MGPPGDELGARLDPMMIQPTCTPYCSIYQACGTSDGCSGTCSQPGVTCAYPRASAGGLTDVDNDGVPDALELALAQKFMPKLIMSNTTDKAELFAYSGGGMSYRVDQVVGFTEVGQYLLIQYALPY